MALDLFGEFKANGLLLQPLNGRKPAILAAICYHIAGDCAKHRPPRMQVDEVQLLWEWLPVTITLRQDAAPTEKK
jgi:hypothetical protein